MRSKEFSILCQPFFNEYYDLFNEIPCPSDYVGSHATFLEALKKSIETQKPIITYLRKATIPNDSGIKI